MVRLYFYVEGQTEQGYVAKVLKPHLANFGVWVMGAILAASGRRHGTIYRGGGRSFAAMRRDFGNLLKLHKGTDVRFTTMFDLYALHGDFSGREEADSLRHLPESRVERLEHAFASEMNDPRLVPHIQLYEFETILLCNPCRFADYFENCENAIMALQALIAEEGPPERINDGPDTAPSKRIDTLFPGYGGAKTSAGVEIASSIPLSVLRPLCPHFDAWLTRLESLGGIAP